MENLMNTLDTETQLRVTKKVIKELQEENKELLKALISIKNLKMGDTSDVIGNWDANTHYKRMQKIAEQAIEKALK
jgi:hypothetical protein